MMKGRPYFLPSQVDASMCAGPTFSIPGSPFDAISEVREQTL